MIPQILPQLTNVKPAPLIGDSAAPSDDFGILVDQLQQNLEENDAAETAESSDVIVQEMHFSFMQDQTVLPSDQEALTLATGMRSLNFNTTVPTEVIGVGQIDLTDAVHPESTLDFLSASTVIQHQLLASESIPLGSVQKNAPILDTLQPLNMSKLDVIQTENRGFSPSHLVEQLQPVSLALASNVTSAARTTSAGSLADAALAHSMPQVLQSTALQPTSRFEVQLEPLEVHTLPTQAISVALATDTQLSNSGSFMLLSPDEMQVEKRLPQVSTGLKPAERINSAPNAITNPTSAAHVLTSAWVQLPQALQEAPLAVQMPTAQNTKTVPTASTPQVAPIVTTLSQPAPLGATSRRSTDLAAQSRVSAMSDSEPQDFVQSSISPQSLRPSILAAEVVKASFDAQNQSDAELDAAVASSEPIEGEQSLSLPFVTTLPSARAQVAATNNLNGQLMRHVSAALEGPVDVLLSPEELGRVKFQIRHHGESVSIFLTAERPETISMLRRHGDDLIREFREAGFAGASLDFGSWGQRQQSEPQTPPAFALPEEFNLTPLPRTPIPVSRANLPDGQGLNLRL